MTSDATIESIEIDLLLDGIRARYGYDFRGYAHASLRRRILAALARSGAAHLGELQHRLLYDPEIFGGVLDDLTVRVSEMFRDPLFYLAFRTRIIPILRTYPRLKIWQSGCATGEEVYATAILLVEEGLYDRCQIYATDLSATALEQAKQGIYSGEHLAIYRENYLASGGVSDFASYYTAAYGRIAMREALRKNVLFFQHNLAGDHVFGEMNVIFCRNVLIYFGHELQERVFAMFHESLCPNGFLCLGMSERLPTSNRTAFVAFADAERIYRHGG